MRGLLKIKGKEMLSLNELLNISVAMFAGLMLTRLGNKLRLPDVTAYLVAGVLIGPCVIGALHIPGVGFSSFAELEALGAISDVALGFIAFSIGNEFRLSQLRETGRQALVIGILQALVTTLVVDAALLGLHFLFPQALSVPAAITLGAIAAATAPAATLMVVRQYKAKGKLTDLLLPIVALDDAVGLVVFAVSFGVARALSSGIVDVYTIVVTWTSTPSSSTRSSRSSARCSSARWRAWAWRRSSPSSTRTRTVSR